jgi:hypothetical protein
MIKFALLYPIFQEIRPYKKRYFLFYQKPLEGLIAIQYQDVISSPNL